MNYKHGDWYCKPATKAEAREIIERAVASGAVIETQWNPDDCAFGVHNGVVSWDDEYGTEYTIDEVRQKFPLPSDRQTERTSEKMPPVGWHGEVKLGGKGEWYECVVLPNGGIAYSANGHFWNTDNGHSRTFVFQAIRTEREKWIEAASKVFCEAGESEVSDAALGAVYDAIQSGELKMPEAKQ